VRRRSSSWTTNPTNRVRRSASNSRKLRHGLCSDSRWEPRPALTSAASAPRRPAGAPKPPTIERATFFESVFAEWSKYAGWDNELTEVAFWSAETKSFSEKFEVFRSGDRFYFRSISQFTRPLLTHGVPDNSPLQFTESQAARDEWLKENSAENVRKFLGAPEPGKS
jgi:hypothetical protein